MSDGIYRAVERALASGYTDLARRLVKLREDELAAARREADATLDWLQRARDLPLFVCEPRGAQPEASTAAEPKETP